jgi:hypothetical protein
MAKGKMSMRAFFLVTLALLAEAVYLPLWLSLWMLVNKTQEMTTLRW